MKKKGRGENKKRGEKGPLIHRYFDTKKKNKIISAALRPNSQFH